MITLTPSTKPQRPTFPYIKVITNNIIISIKLDYTALHIVSLYAIESAPQTPGLERRERG